MKIIRPGFKEACGKLYFECSECGCGFAAGGDDVQRIDDGGIYTKWVVNCPCCGERKTAYNYEYDSLHADYIRQLRIYGNAESKKDDTHESTNATDNI